MNAEVCLNGLTPRVHKVSISDTWILAFTLPGSKKKNQLPDLIDITGLVNLMLNECWVPPDPVSRSVYDAKHCFQGL